ncbi:MAG: helix-turn-helix domain-containing protein [Roseibacillus sp.]
MKPESDPLAGHLIATLKDLLRQRQINYQRIADAMDLSLPSVKRMLNKTNLPLDRLLGICRLAGIEPADLFEAAQRNQPQHTLFTKEQDDLFFERPEYLGYFMRLAIEGESPDQIAVSEGLSSLSTARYLQGLEKVGLLERETGEKVRLSISPPFGFGVESRVLRTRHAAFVSETVEAVLSPNSKDVFALLKPLRLRKESFSEMLGELRKTVDKYSFLSESPTSQAEGRKEWRLSVVGGPSATGHEEAAIVELD